MSLFGDKIEGGLYLKDLPCLDIFPFAFYSGVLLVCRWSALSRPISTLLLAAKIRSELLLRNVTVLSLAAFICVALDSITREEWAHARGLKLKSMGFTAVLQIELPLICSELSATPITRFTLLACYFVSVKYCRLTACRWRSCWTFCWDCWGCWGWEG